MSLRFTKVPEIDEERLEDELILLHRTTLQVRVLNPTAAVLWDALDQFSTAEALADLMSEARPDLVAAESLDYAKQFLNDLTEAGFLVGEDRRD